jgi:NAD(P)H-hydrate epimerase
MAVPGRPLFDAASMRATDRAAIEEHGIAGSTLMAAAGAAAASVVRDRLASARRVAIVCGGGNNGGDGLVVAAELQRRGLDVRVAVCASRPYAGDAAWAEGRARESGIELGREVGPALDGAELVVDALLGTGFSGVARGAVAAAIEAIEASGLPVVALDVPSGVDASTGEVAGPAVHARVTVTFHGEKLGLRVRPGADHAGEVLPVAIGIPREAEAPAPAVLVGAEAIAALPRRPQGGSKYDAGRVVVAAGSQGMSGAAVLASRAALRAGAGIVTACVAATVQPLVAVGAIEVMTQPCADRDGALQPEAEATIRRVLERGGAFVLGPGLGRDPGTAALVRALVRVDVPLLLDADGLHALGQELELLAGRGSPTVITPHGGEAGRLLGWDRARMDAHRLAAARELASRSGAVALLKGADTIVATPDGRLAIRDGDEPGLATAGTGDVLSGTIGALLARGAEPFLAASAGAAAHLAAARAAVEARPGRAIIAGDVADHLPLG